MNQCKKNVFIFAKINLIILSLILFIQFILFDISHALKNSTIKFYKKNGYLKTEEPKTPKSNAYKFIYNNEKICMLFFFLYIKLIKNFRRRYVFRSKLVACS